MSGVYPGYCQPKPIAAVTSSDPRAGSRRRADNEAPGPPAKSGSAKRVTGTTKTNKEVAARTLDQVRWTSPQTVEACTMRSSHARDTEEVRSGVP